MLVENSLKRNFLDSGDISSTETARLFPLMPSFGMESEEINGP